MNPENSQQSATEESGNLDPQIVNYLQATKQVESGGNYSAKGKSGEYGAYQFEPSTWNADAPKYGVDVPLEQADPEQQNEVAYKTVADLKKEHPDWNVGNLASYWNSGNPNAYQNNNVGTNSEGVSYDTPAYAQKVASTYQAIKNGAPDTSSVSGTPNVQDTTADTMPTWEKLLYGLGAVGVGAGAIALGQPEALPEAGALASQAAAGAGEITGGAGSGILSQGASDAVSGVKGLISNPVGTILKASGITGLAGEAINEGKNILGIGDNAQANANEQAGATEQAGQTEADATTQAEQSQEQEEESLADEKAAQDSLQNKQNATQAYLATLGQSASGTKLSQTPQAQMGIDYLTTNGIAPNLNAQGLYETQSDQKEIDKNLSDLNEREQELHTASGDTGDLETVRSEAKQAVRQDNRIPSTEYPTADKEIDEKIDFYKAQMGENPTLGKGGIGLIRSDGYKSFDRNASNAKNVAGRALGRAANKHMLDKSSNKELIAGLHKEKEKGINAKAVLKHLDGKKAIEKHSLVQKLLHGSGKYAALYIGDKLGGPIGAILGDMVGQNIIKKVDKRYGKNVFEKPAVQKAMQMLKKDSPEIYGKIEKRLHQYGVHADLEKAKKEREAKMDEKRKAYQEKNKQLEKKSEYSPYTEKGLIDFGKIGKSKHQKTVKGLPVIR